MTFRGTFTRGDRSLAVVGQVQQTSGGWRGTFTFAKADAPTIAPGPGEITPDTGGLWEIMVEATTTSSESADGESTFRVLKGLP
jgi:hypothetical protein